MSAEEEVVVNSVIPIEIKRYKNAILVSGSATKNFKSEFKELRGGWKKNLGGWLFPFSKRHAIKDIVISKYPDTVLPINIYSEQLSFVGISPENVKKLSKKDLVNHGVMYSKRLEKYIVHESDIEQVNKLIDEQETAIQTHESIQDIAKQEYINTGIDGVHALISVYPEQSSEHRILNDIILSLTMYEKYRMFFEE